jgi:Phage tail tube protein
MALNENAPYTGAVQYLMDYNAGTTLAVGVVVGGSYDINANLRRAYGIGGQKLSRGGLVAATVQVELQEPLKNLFTGMLRATPATAVASRDFVFGNQDGEWKYEGCQPGGFAFECAASAIPQATVAYWAKTPSQTEIGGSQAAVSGGLTDNWSDFDVLVDAADYQCQRFRLTLKTNPFGFTTLDSRPTGSKRLPVEVLLGGQEVELELDCAAQIPAASSSIIADTVDNDIDVVIAGTGITFTLSNLNTPLESGPFENDSGLVIWRYRFTDNHWAALSIA